jgi:hypothetical protein
MIVAVPGQPGLFRHGLGDAALDARRAALEERNRELRSRVAVLKDRVVPLLRYFPGALDPITLRSSIAALRRIPGVNISSTFVRLSAEGMATIIKAGLTSIFANLDLSQALGGMSVSPPVTDDQFTRNASKITSLQTTAWGTLEALERLVDSARSATDVVDDARRAVGLGWVDIVVEGIVFIVVASLVYLVIERILIAYRAHSSAIDACEQQLRATGVPCTGDQLLSYERLAAEREGQYGVLPAVGAAVSNVGEAAAGATRMVPLVLGVVGIAALIAYSRPGTAGYAAYESASAAASRAASSASAAASRAASRARAAASSARARFSRA